MLLRNVHDLPPDLRLGQRRPPRQHASPSRAVLNDVEVLVRGHIRPVLEKRPAPAGLNERPEWLSAFDEPEHRGSQRNDSTKS